MMKSCPLICDKEKCQIAPILIYDEYLIILHVNEGHFVVPIHDVFYHMHSKIIKRNY